MLASCGKICWVHKRPRSWRASPDFTASCQLLLKPVLRPERSEGVHPIERLLLLLLPTLATSLHTPRTPPYLRSPPAMTSAWTGAGVTANAGDAPAYTATEEEVASLAVSVVLNQRGLAAACQASCSNWADMPLPNAVPCAKSAGHHDTTNVYRHCRNFPNLSTSHSLTSLAFFCLLLLFFLLRRRCCCRFIRWEILAKQLPHRSRQQQRQKILRQKYKQFPPQSSPVG